ncbi:MAG TPA: hypothetical protein VFB49_13140 [Patescibacteria group bacterium]|nr:hypothetical protein [Patescibacteria group bacterium]
MNRMMRAAALGLFVTVPWPAAVAAPGAPVAERLSVDSAEVGRTVIIVGRGFAGGDVVVAFGPAAASVSSSGRSRQTIAVEVPGKLDPLDPDAVTVTVFVNGREALYPNGALRFTYDVPRPYPVIEDYRTGDPQAPKSVFVARPFVIHLVGTHFTTGRRVPVACLAIGPTTEKAGGLFGEATDSAMAFEFAGLPYAGSYRFLVGFSDGSTAGIDAVDFASQPFGRPPVIQQAEAVTETETVSCDFTQVAELGVCAFTGLSDVRALPPGVFIEGSYTALRLSALVTDADSIPGRTDILLAIASYLDPRPSTPPTEVSLLLLDDGSSAAFPSQQKAQWLEDCSDATPDACVCRAQVFALTSGDAISGDDRYTRRVALVNPSTNPLLRDCITQQAPQFQVLLAPDASIGFTFEVVDREGNLSRWPVEPAIREGTDTLSCAGDPCGCCLLLSIDPTSPPPAGCSGLEGMISPALPGGVCRSF